MPTAAREVYDVTGAGDTVIATLAASLAAGASLVEAAMLANHAAGVVVGKLGTATATAEELLASFPPDAPLKTLGAVSCITADAGREVRRETNISGISLHAFRGRVHGGACRVRPALAPTAGPSARAGLRRRQFRPARVRSSGEICEGGRGD